ncbi:MAG TPA: hypothetical protein VMG35_23085 [Bryobacteraceae bacterium]|nr:hypothetical protein [Bryobacteraceae bacterium]
MIQLTSVGRHATAPGPRGAVVQRRVSVAGGVAAVGQLIGGVDFGIIRG